MKRLLVLDWMRGYFIMLVIILHAFGHLLFLNAELIAVEEIRWYVIALFAPLILLGTWAPIFALLSGVANAYVLHQFASREPKETLNAGLWKHVKGIWLNSAALMAVSLFSNTFLHFGMNYNGEVRRSLITGSLEVGAFRLPDIDIIFYQDAIALIAMSGFILGGLMYLLWRDGGIEKTRRNHGILIGLALAAFAVSPSLHAWLEPLYFEALSARNYLLAIPLKLLVGPPHSTIPNGGFALFGAVFGIALAQDAPYRMIQRFGYGFCAFFLVVAGSLVAMTGFRIEPDMIGTALPMPLHLLNLSLMLALLTFLIGFFEYQSPERRRVLASKTTFARRFGLMAMTCYVFESLICVINMKWFMTIWTPEPLIFRYLVLFSFTAMQFFMCYGILRLWEKANFRYSIEWCVITLVGHLRGRRSARLNTAQVLYQPVDPPAAAEVPAKTPLINPIGGPVLENR